jgi:hypothetical protein
MPGKQARVLCPVCQEPIPPDETECWNCGAFVIDEAIVRLSRALGLDRDTALRLFEAGFRHPKQLEDRDPSRVLEKGEVGLLFICTNCGSFVSTKDTKCPRCAAEFETEPESPPTEEEDILDLVLCPVCGADNDPELAECEICGEALREPGEPGRVGVEKPVVPLAVDEATKAASALEKVDDFLHEPEPMVPLVKPEAVPSRPPTTASQAVPVAPAKPIPAPPKAPASVPAKPIVAPLPGKPPPVPEPSPPPPIPRKVIRPSTPPRSPSHSETPAPALEIQRTPGASSAEPMVPPALPVKRLRERLPPRILQKKVRRASHWRFPKVSAEIAGGLTLAAGASLLLAGSLGQRLVSGGLGAFLIGFGAYLTTQQLRGGGTRPSILDGLLLAVGAVVGIVVPLLHRILPSSTLAVGLAVAGAIPLSWATRRLLRGPQRILLALASSIPLSGHGLATALDPGYASTIPWLVGILAATPWPGALAAAEILRRKSTALLRRQVGRAERDMQKQDYEHSLSEYDRAIGIARAGVPGAEVPWYGKGASLVLLGRYEEALRAIDTALDINPRSEVAWLNKGNALTKLGRVDEALRCFNAAIKVSPSYEVAWNNKGNALARLGKFDEAVGCYERALAIDASYRGAWVNMGFVLTKLGRFDEAASCADRALVLDSRGRADPI